MNLLSLLKIEFIKQKKSFAWKVAFITPIICFCILLAFWHFEYDSLMSSSFIQSSNDLGINSQLDTLLYTNHLCSLWFILSSLSLILITESVNYIEHSENCWKQLLAMPINRSKVYLSKWLFVFILSCISIVLNALGFISVGFIFKIQSCFNIAIILKYIVFQILCSLSIISFQHFLGFYFKNLLVPLCVGFGGIINTIMFAQSKFLSNIIPYTPTLNAVPLGNGINANTAATAGAIQTVFWLIIGIVIFNRQDIK